MAKIRNAKAKNSSGSYARVFNHQLLGDLITKIHSTAIAISPSFFNNFPCINIFCVIAHLSNGASKTPSNVRS